MGGRSSGEAGVRCAGRDIGPAVALAIAHEDASVLEASRTRPRRMLADGRTRSRLGNVAEMVVALYLASGESGVTTGTVTHADGGQRL